MVRHSKIDACAGDSVEVSLQRRRRRSAWRALAGVGGLAVVAATMPLAASTASAAGPVVVTCGQVITQSTKLAGNVGPCPANGVIIGADHITLDLNGHTLAGARTQLPSGDAGGIRLPLRTGVTVMDGTVTGFDGGIVVNGGSGNTFKNLTVSDNNSSANADSSGNFTADLGDGIVIFGSAGNVVKNDTIQRNGIYDNVAIIGGGSDNNTVQSNTITDTVGAGRNGFDVILNGVDNNGTVSLMHNDVIANNVIANANSAGIFDADNVGGIIRGNTITNTDQAIRVDNHFASGTAQSFSNALISGNHVDQGSRELSGIDILSLGNRVIGNTVTNNIGTSRLGAIGGIADQALGGVLDQNSFIGNTITNNSGTGLLLSDGATAIGNAVTNNLHDLGNGLQGRGGIELGNSDVVRDNVVVNNTGNGIDVEETSNDTITGNQVHGNSDSGIYVEEVFGQVAVSKNVISANNFANNAVNPHCQFDVLCVAGLTGILPLAADMLEVATVDVSTFDCGTDVWSGNLWGTGGFAPPCTGAGGHQVTASSASTSTAAQSAATGGLAGSLSSAPRPAVTTLDASPRHPLG